MWRAESGRTLDHLVAVDAIEVNDSTQVLVATFDAPTSVEVLYGAA